MKKYEILEGVCLTNQGQDYTSSRYNYQGKFYYNRKGNEDGYEGGYAHMPCKTGSLLQN